MASRRQPASAVPDSDRKMLPAVEAALAELDLAPEDVGVARLAEGYARTIDQAAAIAAAAQRIPFDPDTADEVKRLAARVSAHATMADLGPKLLAALESLGGSPKARAAAGKSAGKPAAPRSSALAALRKAAG